jgi:hypothetical protein
MVELKPDLSRTCHLTFTLNLRVKKSVFDAVSNEFQTDKARRDKNIISMPDPTYVPGVSLLSIKKSSTGIRIRTISAWAAYVRYTWCVPCSIKQRFYYLSFHG